MPTSHAPLHRSAFSLSRCPKIRSRRILYLQFQLGDRWIIADDLRRSDESLLDETEEAAIEEALYVIRHYHREGKTFNQVEATRRAAELVAKRPKMIDEARQRLAERGARAAEIDLSALGLA